MRLITGFFVRSFGVILFLLGLGDVFRNFSITENLQASNTFMIAGALVYIAGVLETFLDLGLEACKSAGLIDKKVEDS